ncbi:hypothetical protein [Xanthomonas axonopodis]|uniref:hypothetical protein n=1 Tax=Xanthomonas axonopodis TaxID=53413 RepID=UPI003558C0CB
MTNISKAESFEDGFLRAALEVIAKRDEREAIITSQDFDGLKQLSTPRKIGPSIVRGLRAH